MQIVFKSKYPFASLADFKFHAEVAEVGFLFSALAIRKMKRNNQAADRTCNWSISRILVPEMEESLITTGLLSLLFVLFFRWQSGILPQ